jgi:hypothetical protein
VLSVEAIGGLTATQIAALSVEAIGGLTAQIAALSVEAVGGLTAAKIAALSADAVAGFTVEQVASMTNDALAGFTATQTAQFTNEVVAGFTAGQVTSLIAEAFGGFSVTQMGQFTADALGGVSVAQAQNLSVEALSGLNATNMVGFQKEIWFDRGLDILNAVALAEVQQLPTLDFVSIASSLNAETVKPADIETFLPTDWEISVNGDLIPPVGEVPSLMVPIENLPENVSFPPSIDLTLDLSLGSTAGSLLSQMDQVLVASEFAEYSFSQEKGIVQLTSADANLSYMVAKVEQMAAGSTEAGFSVDNSSGRRIVTTDTGLQLTLLPTMKDPALLLNVIPGAKLEVNQYSETRIEFNHPSLGELTVFGMFDPLTENAPAGTEPGVTSEGTVGVDKVGIITYPDGTMQRVYPSVENRDTLALAHSLLPDLGLYGGNRFLVDGQIEYVYNGLLFRVVPTFDVTIGFRAPSSAPEIVHVAVLEPNYQRVAFAFISEAGDRQLLHAVLIGDASEFEDEE